MLLSPQARLLNTSSHDSQATWRRGRCISDMRTALTLIGLLVYLLAVARLDPC